MSAEKHKETVTYVKLLLREKGVITAVKYVRKKHDLGLREAKEYVDLVSASIKKEG